MGTYYISTTGNDSTGDGSSGAPWATFHKAITTVTDNEAHTVIAAPGTYAENSGSGYLNILQNRTEVLTLQSATGDPEDVIITGVSGTYSILFGSGTNAKITFQNVTFRNTANTTQYCVALHANSVLSDLIFTNCIFEVQVGGNTSAKTGLYCGLNDLKTVQNVTVDGCTFRFTGTRLVGETLRAVSLTRSAAGATLDSVTFTDNTVTSDDIGVILGAVTNLTCTGNLIQTNEGVALTCGFDSGTTAQTTDGIVSGNTVKSSESHGLLLGNGCDGLIAWGNRVIGGDHGVVLKNSVDVVFRGNLVYGPSTMMDAIYIKASNGARVYDNVAMCTKSGGWVLRVGEDTTHVTLYQAASVYGNTLVARNGAHLYYWGPDAEEIGETSVCNYNTLIQAGSGNYGTVKDTSDIATLAAVNTAWSAYDVTTNDDNSADGDLAWYPVIFGGGGGSGLGL